MEAFAFRYGGSLFAVPASQYEEFAEGLRASTSYVLTDGQWRRARQRVFTGVDSSDLREIIGGLPVDDPQPEPEPEPEPELEYEENIGGLGNLKAFVMTLLYIIVVVVQGVFALLFAQGDALGIVGVIGVSMALLTWATSK